LLPSGTSGASFGKPPDVKLLSESRRTKFSFLQKAATPPEVKLPEGSEGRPSFGRKPKDALPSGGSRRTPPEVQLPEGRSESRRTRFFQNKFRKKKDALPEGSGERSAFPRRTRALFMVIEDHHQQA